MKFSLNIVLEVLKQYNLENHVESNIKYEFNECLPLPDELDTLNTECVYVGNLTRALGLPADICCICVRDRIKDSKESTNNLNGLVIVNENITQNELLEKIIKQIFGIMNWQQKMNEVLIDNGALQDIVDLCPPILNNYIAINDASLMLLAYSRTIQCDDPICIEFVRHGYHTDEYIRKFRKYKLLKTWENANDIFIDDTCEVAKYVVVHKVFRVQNKYFAHIVMTCNREPVTPYLLEVFKMFVAVVDKYIKRMYEGKNKNIHIYDTLLTDLIERKVKKKKIIEERARYVGLPLNGPHCLFLIESNETANISIGHMLNEFSELFPWFKYVTYNKSIVAIQTLLTNSTDENLNTVNHNMEDFLQKYDAQCGVSQVYDSLEETSYAYRQAKLALRYMNRICASTLFKDNQAELYKRIHFFSQKFLYCMIDESENHAELWYHSEYYKKLRILYEYDQKHQSNYIELLNIFISQGQNATKVGHILMTHRNNIMYHVSRIKELINVDFSSTSVCFALQLSIVLIELYGFVDES